MGHKITRVHRETVVQKPWNSDNAFHPAEDKYVPIHFPDTKEAIDYCMNCPLPAVSCTGSGNCYVIKEGGKAFKRRGKFNMEGFRQAIEMGLSNSQMAVVFNVRRATVVEWKKKYGITGQKDSKQQER